MSDTRGALVIHMGKPKKDDERAEGRKEMLRAASGALIGAMKAEDAKAVGQILSDIMAMGPTDLGDD